MAFKEEPADTVSVRGRRRKKKGEPVEEGGLYDALRALRAEIAAEEQVPQYIVFSNATLADMAERRPMNRSELLEVSGVGEKKAAQYGERFLEAIRDWKTTESIPEELLPEPTQPVR